jgi:DNA-binding transcriptional regulator GbsR (MarR family)
MAEQPKTLDEIAADLFFSKATASLTVRQGLALRLFEKVSIPGERKDLYRASSSSWINLMADKINALVEWEELVGQGLCILKPENHVAVENLSAMKDYLDFLRWYMDDFKEQYELWKNGKIDKKASKETHNE